MSERVVDRERNRAMRVRVYGAPHDTHKRLLFSSAAVSALQIEAE